MTVIVNQSLYPVQAVERRFWHGNRYHCISAKVTLGYDASIAQEKGGRPFGVDALRAIQLSKREVLEVLARRLGGADSKFDRGRGGHGARCAQDQFGGAGLDAKHQLALLVLKHIAAHGQADDQQCHAQQGQPAQTQAREKT